jgi:hypothetical protein
MRTSWRRGRREVVRMRTRILVVLTEVVRMRTRILDVQTGVVRV